MGCISSGYGGVQVKISDCKHLPKKFAKPRTDKCEGGDTCDY